MLQSQTSLRENGFEAQTYSEVLKIRGESKRITIWVKNWKKPSQINYLFYWHFLKILKQPYSRS